MNKLIKLFAFLFLVWTLSLMLTEEVNAQKVKTSKESKEVLAKASKWVYPVDGFALIWYDTEGRMDLHETMSKIEKDYDPDLTFIKDEELGIWRLAITMEENQRMPDNMAVIKGKYTKAIPYKRTGYID